MKTKKLPIYCADFETTSYNQYLQEGRTRVYLWCLKSLDEKVSLIGVNLQSFFENLININGEFVVYFHNLSFDGEFINWYLLENNYTYAEKDQMKVKTFNSIIDESGRYVKKSSPSASFKTHIIAFTAFENRSFVGAK